MPQIAGSVATDGEGISAINRLLKTFRNRVIPNEVRNLALKYKWLRNSSLPAAPQNDRLQEVFRNLLEFENRSFSPRLVMRHWRTGPGNR
jgi:hypothetical protein